MASTFEPSAAEQGKRIVLASAASGVASSAASLASRSGIVAGGAAWQSPSDAVQPMSFTTADSHVPNLLQVSAALQT